MKDKVNQERAGQKILIIFKHQHVWSLVVILVFRQVQFKKHTT